MAPERGVPENTGRKQEAAVIERAKPCGSCRGRASLIVNNNEFAMAGNFACNDNGVGRQSPQITTNINARTMAGMPYDHYDHYDQTKTRRGVPAGHSSRVSISRII